MHTCIMSVYTVHGMEVHGRLHSTEESGCGIEWVNGGSHYLKGTHSPLTEGY
jgi:hypothetical protein